MNIQVNDNNSINLSLANSSTTLTADDSELKHIEVGDASAVSLSVASVAEIPLVAGDTTAITSNPYEGAYEWTPTTSQQTISIKDKTATNDIIINPIPSNYGLITWNGSTLTVS